MTKSQFKHKMAKDKFLRFQNQRRDYLNRFNYSWFTVLITDDDRLLQQLLQVPDESFYASKSLMQMFKRRFTNWVPASIETSRRSTE